MLCGGEIRFNNFSLMATFVLPAGSANSFTCARGRSYKKIPFGFFARLYRPKAGRVIFPRLSFGKQKRLDGRYDSFVKAHAC
jgi:hypothetical protein